MFGIGSPVAHHRNVEERLREKQTTLRWKQLQIDFLSPKLDEIATFTLLLPSSLSLSSVWLEK